MVERTAHNGFVVGSNPTKPIKYFYQSNMDLNSKDVIFKNYYYYFKNINIILFCKQHCHQETLKSRFQSSTFCRFYASSYFDKVYIRIACSTLFINKISPILSRCSFLVKVRCPVSKESV